MNNERLTVRALTNEEVPEVVDILCESFFDYPVMRIVVGASQDYERRLNRLIYFFVMARVYRREVMLGVGDSGRMIGTALVSYPTRPENPPELAKLREEVWEELGDAVRTKYEAFGAACAPLMPDDPHTHLNMIGVRRSAQGKGVGRVLIEYVHQMSSEDPNSNGVSLTTEVEANVALYEHFGYELVGHTVITHELETWGFFRADSSES